MEYQRRLVLPAAIVCGAFSFAFDSGVPQSVEVADSKIVAFGGEPSAATLPVIPPVRAGSVRPLPASDFSLHIEAAARKNGVRPELIRAIIETESRFDASAVSERGACGLMQLMPRTARSLGVVDCFNASENIHAGARHLSVLLKRYEGSLDMSIAAYNAGEGAVARHRGIPPYRQTRAYVRKVTALLAAS
jgi:soluble lytic murein transglycosylase-like protein